MVGDLLARAVLGFCGLVSIGAIAWSVFPAATEWYADRLVDRVYGVVFYRRLRAERLEARRRIHELSVFDQDTARFAGPWDLAEYRETLRRAAYRPDEAA